MGEDAKDKTGAAVAALAAASVDDVTRRQAIMATVRYYGLDPDVAILGVVDDGDAVAVIVRLPVLKEDVPPAEETTPVAPAASSGAAR